MTVQCPNCGDDAQTMTGNETDKPGGEIVVTADGHVVSFTERYVIEIEVEPCGCTIITTQEP